MNCENCIYCPACKVNYLDVDINSNICSCALFKNKANFIETPCKIGDEIYDVSFEKGDIYNHINIYRIQDVSAKYIYFADDIIEHSNLGEFLFLDLDQARAKLRELEAEQ